MHRWRKRRQCRENLRMERRAQRASLVIDHHRRCWGCRVDIIWQPAITLQIAKIDACSENNRISSLLNASVEPTQKQLTDERDAASRRRSSRVWSFPSDWSTASRNVCSLLGIRSFGWLSFRTRVYRLLDKSEVVPRTSELLQILEHSRLPYPYPALDAFHDCGDSRALQSRDQTNDRGKIVVQVAFLGDSGVQLASALRRLSHG